MDSIIKTKHQGCSMDAAYNCQEDLRLKHQMSPLHGPPPTSPPSPYFFPLLPLQWENLSEALEWKQHWKTMWEKEKLPPVSRGSENVPWNQSRPRLLREGPWLDRSHSVACKRDCCGSLQMTSWAPRTHCLKILLRLLHCKGLSSKRQPFNCYCSR